MYKANQTSLQLLKDLKEAETELETLKSYVIDLKSKVAIYVPVKEDEVDMKLADFINNYPDRHKLKIIFLRESEGVYSFGTKKILIKVQNNKIKSKPSNFANQIITLSYLIQSESVVDSCLLTSFLISIRLKSWPSWSEETRLRNLARKLFCRRQYRPAPNITPIR